MCTFNLIFRYKAVFLTREGQIRREDGRQEFWKRKFEKVHLSGTFVESYPLTLNKILFNSYLDVPLSGNLEKLFYSSAKSHLKFEY